MEGFWDRILSDAITLGVLLAIAALVASKITKKSVGELLKDIIAWFKEVGGEEGE